MLERIVSGGQTGVDRAGLDAALDAGLPVGGWCPRGRLAEDGVVPDSYPLVEMGSNSYTSRTEQNVIDSDGTLVFNEGVLANGTKRTVEFARQHRRPFLVVQLDDEHDPAAIRRWIDGNGIRILNVAGPRESKCPGIHGRALALLRRILRSD